MFCAVVDTNIMPAVVQPTDGTSCQILVDDLYRGRGHLYIGGQLRREVKHNQQHAQWLSVGIARGWIKSVDDAEVDGQEEQVKVNPSLSSDDPHIIALAQVAGARLLVSQDGDLVKDFKNKDFLDQPRGKVFPLQGQSSSIRRFLQRSQLCTRQALALPENT